MKRSKIICLGEALVDRLGPLGGNPSLDKPVEDCLGGAPANVACGLSRLGVDVAFVGCLGNDDIGREFLNLFQSRNIDIKGLQINEHFPSRIVLVQRDSDGERSFVGFAGDKGNGFADQSLHLIDLKKIWPELIQDATWLVLGTILLASETSRETVLWVVDQAKKIGLNIAIDVNWRPTFWNEGFISDMHPSKEVSSLILSFLKNASLIKLAKEEAISFFHSDDPFKISSTYLNKPNVIITNGSKPIKWHIDGFTGILNSLSPPRIVDTTGAGDAFMSGLIAKLSSKLSIYQDYSSLEEIIRFAAGCGALVCGASGAIKPQPTVLEVENFLSLTSGDLS